jgi:hypothetical protein
MTGGRTAVLVIREGRAMIKSRRAGIGSVTRLLSLATLLAVSAAVRRG